MSPGKVAEALRQLARRAADAEKGTDEATKDRGMLSSAMFSGVEVGR